MENKREIIENIRRKRFGIGIDWSKVDREVAEYHQDNEQFRREVAKLSQDIFTKKPHFLLELVQNADDNEYHPDVEPRLKFLVFSDKIVAQNNENGFTKENVDALCKVGGTTKRNRSQGYIGEKGIGFKSVFLVADVVTIYSNGFQFRFSNGPDPVDIIRPTWVDEMPDYIDKSQTNIVLHLSPKLSSSEKSFVEILEKEPVLLLFTRKLKCIEIEDKCNGRKFMIMRKDEDNKVRIVYKEGESCWKLIKRLLEVPEEIRNEEEKRKDIHETEVVLGFLLKEDGTPDTSKSQKVFSFLPVRECGFKFIIQGDFLLASNREDIHKDNRWNKWLFENIVILFVSAVEEFKTDEKLGKSYYRYIPNPAEIQDEFFANVANQIAEKLTHIRFILTASNEWEYPESIVIPEEPLRAIVPSEILKKVVGKSYISPEINEQDVEHLKKVFGIKKFTFELLIEILKNDEWLKNQPDEWLIRLYEYLDERLKDEDIEVIKSLKLVRLENGEMASSAEQSIFFPLDKKESYGFEQELRVVKSAICEGHERSKIVGDFLKRIGVRKADPYEIIENHILPLYEKDKARMKTPQQLFGYVRYIKEHIDEYEKKSDEKINGNKKSWEKKEDPLSRLKRAIYIRGESDRISRYIDTYKNTEYIQSLKDKFCVHDVFEKCFWVEPQPRTYCIYFPPSSLYLSKKYLPDEDLEKLFSGFQSVIFVHPEYGEYKPATTSQKDTQKFEEEIKSWRNFFLKIGVNDTFRIEESFWYHGEQSWKYKNDCSLPEWMTDEERKKLIESGKDEKLPEGIRKYIEEIKKREENHCTRIILEEPELYPSIPYILGACKDVPDSTKAQALLHHLSKHWETLSKEKNVKFWLYYRGWQHQKATEYNKPNLDASWYTKLKDSEWIPTKDGRFMKPINVFVDKQEIRDILGDTVSYLAVEVKNEELLKDLGIHLEPTVEGVMNTILNLVKSRCEDIDKFVKLYDFLEKHWEHGLGEKYCEHPFIYVPGTSKKYFKSNEVFWKDASEIFGEARGYLEKHYKSLENFFLEKLSIRREPKPEDYAKLLSELAKSKEINEELRKKVKKIYRKLNDWLRDNQVSQWWDDCIKEPIFLVDKGEFWYNHGNIFVNDDQNIYELFKNKQEVAFLDISEKEYPRFIYFIEKTGLKYVSSAVKIELGALSENPTENKTLTMEILKRIPYILRYLYFKEHEYFEINKEKLKKINKLRCYVVDKLEVKYILNNTEAWKSEEILLNGNDLYIKKECQDNRDKLSIELAKLFEYVRGIEDFIALIFSKNNEHDIDNLLKVKNIPQLPEAELKFFACLDETELQHPHEAHEEITIIPPKDKFETTSLINQEQISPGVGVADAKSSEDREYIQEKSNVSSVSNEIDMEKGRIHTSELDGEQKKERWRAEITPVEAKPRLVTHLPVSNEERASTETATLPCLGEIETPRDTKEIDTHIDRKYVCDRKEDMSEEEKKEIGRWGEEYVMYALKKEYEKLSPTEMRDTEDGFEVELADGSRYRVVWINAKEDRGIGYDILVQDTMSQDVIRYIEVKTTTSDQKSYFEVSRAQWEMMERKGEKYHIYRVYNAGSDKDKVFCLDVPNPAKLWREGKIKAQPVRLYM